MNAEKKNYTLPIIVMIFLFGMISFVTNLASPMGDILKNQFQVANWMGTLGVFANFIAYAIMGYPAGNMLQKMGYKKTALVATSVGFIGLGIQTLSGVYQSFGIYLLGAFIAGFSMCLLNTVVNPMLNKLGGGGDKGNQLIQTGGAFNSLCGTAVIILTGLLIPQGIKNAQISNVFPLMYAALAIFAFAFLVILMTDIPENKRNADAAKTAEKSKYGPLSFRHFVLGAVAIFVYVGVEVGIPNVLQKWLQNPELHILADANPELGIVSEAADEPVQPIVETGLEAVEESVQADAAVEIAAETEVVATEAAAEVEEAAPVVEEAVAVVEDAAAPAGDETVTAEEEVVAPVEAEETISQGGVTAEAIAGSITAMYWLLMLVGRLLGAAVGSKVSAKKMLMVVSAVGLALTAAAIFVDPQSNTFNMPAFNGASGFQMVNVPLNAALLVLTGLCTSVMWGGIFNLAVEGLGKYTEKASGIFMVLVCGGGILPLLQNAIIDNTNGGFGYLSSYWVIVGCLLFLLYYAVVGCKNVNKDIPVED